MYLKKWKLILTETVVQGFNIAPTYEIWNYIGTFKTKYVSFYFLYLFLDVDSTFRIRQIRRRT